MKGRRKLWLGVAGVVLAGVWLCQTLAAAEPGKAGNGGLPADLQQLIEEALANNAELKQMGGIRAASRQAERSAGALDDPMIGFTLKDLPADNWSFIRDPMTQKMFEVSQKLPFPGKRRLRTEVAEEQTKVDDLAYRDKANEVRAKMMQAYWGLSLAHTSFEVTQKNKQFWEQVVQVTESRYGVGMGQQADVLQAQVELGNYLDRLLTWQQGQESLTAQINALRSQPPQTVVARPQPLRPRSYGVNLEELLDKAQDRPQLQALKALISKQDKAVDLAKKEYYPDLTLGVGYGLRQNYLNQRRPDMFTATANINVPLWFASKQTPKVREEEAKRAAAKDALQSSWNQVAAAIRDRMARLVRLEQQVTLYAKGIIPQARQAAEASLAAYRVGTLDFSRLYQAQITALENELRLQEYLKDAEENWAELEWLVGQELSRRPGGKR